MKNIFNWWSPQPVVDEIAEQCGDIFKQMGYTCNTPSLIKNICCPFEQAFGLTGLPIAIIAGTALAGGFIYRGGPQYLWNKVRSKTPTELMMLGVQTYLSVKFGVDISQLTPPITSTLDKILPEVIEQKKQQKRHDILKKLNNMPKMQKDAAIKYDTPEYQKEIEKNINEELTTNIKNYLMALCRTHGERFSNGSEEDKNVILNGLKDFLLYDKLPSFNVQNHNSTSTNKRKI